MKNPSLLLISLFTFSFTFGQPTVPNLREWTHELSFHLNKEQHQALKNNNSEQFKLDSVVMGYFDPITDLKKDSNTLTQNQVK